MVITEKELKDLRVTQGKKLREIAEIFNCSVAWVSLLLKKYNIKKVPRVRIHETFGRLKILNAKCGADKHGHPICLCMCECGKEVKVVRYCLLDGNTRSCGCLRPNQSPEHTFIPKFIWKSLRNSSRVRGHKVSVTIDYLGQIYIEQEGLCALSGVQLVFGEDCLGTTASIDRIDSSKPYEPGNVQWVHKHVNRMKQSYSQEYFIETCKKIAQYHSKT